MWVDRMALKHEYLRQLVDCRLDCAGSAQLQEREDTWWPLTPKYWWWAQVQRACSWRLSSIGMAFPAGLLIRTTGLPMRLAPLPFRRARWKFWTPLALRTSLFGLVTSATPKRPILPSTNSSTT